METGTGKSCVDGGKGVSLFYMHKNEILKENMIKNGT